MADESGGGGSGRPGWIQGGTDFEVDITRLDDFAAQVGSETKDFAGSMTGGITQMMADAGRFGMGGLAEGRSYATLEARYRGQLGHLLTEVQLGLDAITHAAYAVSEEYQGADALSKASIETTRAAFTGIEGRPLLSDQRAAAEKAARDGGANGPVPKDIEETVRENVPGDQGSGPGSGPGGDDGRTYYDGQAGEYTVPADRQDYSDYDTTVPSDDDVRQEMEEREPVVLAPGPLDGTTPPTTGPVSV